MHTLAIKTPAILICVILWSLSAQTDTLPEVDVHAPYIATPYPVVHAMLALAHVGPNDLLIDMGCGDGQDSSSQAAKRYGAHAIGVDINPERIAEARENAKRAGVEPLVRFEERMLLTTKKNPQSRSFAFECRNTHRCGDRARTASACDAHRRVSIRCRR